MYSSVHVLILNKYRLKKLRAATRGQDIYGKMKGVSVYGTIRMGNSSEKVVNNEDCWEGKWESAWRCGWEGGRRRGETQAKEENKKEQNFIKAQNVTGKRGVAGGERGS